MSEFNRASAIALPAFIAALIGPAQNVAGWSISAALWPGFDSFSSTISDLAADDSPVQWIQSSFFLFGTALTFVVAIYARAIAMPGRITLVLAGIASIGLTVFATPSQDGYSIPHRVFASFAFVFFAIWPILGMRRDPKFHWTLRPIGALSATAVMGLTTLWFLLTWLDPERSLVGLAERVIVLMQVLWMSIAIIGQFCHQKRGQFTSIQSTKTGLR